MHEMSRTFCYSLKYELLKVLFKNVELLNFVFWIGRNF